MQQAPLNPYVPASFEFATTIIDYNHSTSQPATDREQQAGIQPGGLDAGSFRAWLADKESKATGKPQLVVHVDMLICACLNTLVKL